MAKTCTRCGFQDLDEAAFCNKCGRRFLDNAPRNPSCPNCGHHNPIEAGFCAGCGSLLHPPPPQYDASLSVDDVESYQEGDGLSGRLIAGSILTLLCGVISLGGGVFVIIMSNYISQLNSRIGGDIGMCGAAIVALGVVALVGSVFAFRRENFNFALLGSILGLVGALLAFGLLSLPLGIAAVFFIAISNGDFDY